MRRKWLFSLLLVPAVGGWFWWHVAHSAKNDPADQPKIVSVDRGPVKLVVMASGKVSANDEVDIKCKASGEVVNLPFDESDPVKKGALVLQLDPVDEQRAVDQARAALTAAQCKVTTARDTLAIAELTLVTDTRQAESTEKSAEISAQDMRAKAQRTRREKDKHRYVLVPAKAAATQIAAANGDPPGDATRKNPPTVEREIQTGVDDGAFCEVLSGLQENDKVVLPAGGTSEWAKLKAQDNSD